MWECPYPTDCRFKLRETALAIGENNTGGLVECVAYAMREIASMDEDVPFRNWNNSTVGIRYTNEARPSGLRWTRRGVLGIPGEVDFGVG
jgi:hypothetical protein